MNGYPAEEGPIVNLLRAELAGAQTWMEVCAIARALQNVRMCAERERQRVAQIPHPTAPQQPVMRVPLQPAPNFNQQSDAAAQMNLYDDPRLNVPQSTPTPTGREPWEE